MKLKEAVPDLPLITKIVARYWRVLPPSARNSFSFDDMVATVILHLVIKSPQYNPKRARPSTWIQNITTNKCIDILAHYTTAKRAANETSLDDAESPDYQDSLSDHSVHAREILESKNAFEELLFQASTQLADFIDSVLFKKRNLKPSPEILEELKSLVKKHSLSIRDFRNVICYLVE